MWVPMSSPQKHAELKAREPPARGESIREKIDRLHLEAERRALSAIADRKATAQLHNIQAECVATGSKMAEALVFAERQINIESNMKAHDERHKQHIKNVAAKGTAEVNKVAAAVAALQDASIAARR